MSVMHDDWRLASAGLSDTHESFRATAREFIKREIVPFDEQWRAAGIIDKDVFARAGAAGLLGTDVPEQYGGGGVEDFRFNAIFREEAARAGVGPSAARIALHNDVCIPYFLDCTTEAQRTRWLPGICAGSTVTAIAMTEPSAGSDLAAITTSAVREGDAYVLNGAKTMISNSVNCDLVIVACKTDPTKRHDGMSLLVVDPSSAGFSRGKRFSKVGQASSDLGELFFDDVVVPADHLLGGEGEGFRLLVTKLPRERLSIALDAVYQAEAALALTLDYTSQRTAFGKPIASFQHSRFVLAEMRTELDIARVFVDRQIDALNAGELSAEAAAEAKWWCSELCKRVVDQCVQLHGGYGYMDEFEISRIWRDTRVLTLYGGTTEIMKEIIGRGMGA